MKLRSAYLRAQAQRIHPVLTEESSSKEYGTKSKVKDLDQDIDLFIEFVIVELIAQALTHTKFWY